MCKASTRLDVQVRGISQTTYRACGALINKAADLGYYQQTFAPKASELGR